MEPSQRRSFSTLSMVTSWITSRSLFNKQRYTNHLTVLLTKSFYLNVRFWLFLFLYCRSYDQLKGAYTQPASRRPPCLKFLPGSSFSRLLCFFWKCKCWTNSIKCWHDFISTIFIALLQPTLPRELMDMIRGWLHLVNKWSSCQLCALVIIKKNNNNNNTILQLW